jgi:hypothetical protein
LAASREGLSSVSKYNLIIYKKLNLGMTVDFRA